MRSYFNLLAFELNRFIKIFMTILVIIFLVQVMTVVFQALSYVSLIKSTVNSDHLSPEQFLQEYWSFSLVDVTLSLGFIGPILLGFFTILFYMFFIWYRDWYARNTFIYRLLMLPTSRMTIYFAKLTTILLTLLAMVSFQLIYLVVYQKIVKWMVPLVYRTDLPLALLIESSEYLKFFIPSNLSDFLIVYGLGSSFIIVVFTAILFERSYQFVGKAISIVYFLLALGIFVLPVASQLILFEYFYLYTNELFYVQMAITMFITFLSLMVSRYLLNKKISV